MSSICCLCLDGLKLRPLVGLLRGTYWLEFRRQDVLLIYGTNVPRMPLWTLQIFPFKSVLGSNFSFSWHWSHGLQRLIPGMRIVTASEIGNHFTSNRQLLLLGLAHLTESLELKHFMPFKPAFQFLLLEFISQLFEGIFDWLDIEVEISPVFLDPLNCNFELIWHLIDLWLLLLKEGFNLGEISGKGILGFFFVLG